MKKENIVALLLALMMLVTFTPAGAENAFPPSCFAEDGVVVYRQADEKSEMLGCYFKGTPVTIQAKRDGWYWIAIGHGETEGLLMGYVLASQVEEQGEKEPCFPVITLLGENGTVDVGSDDQMLGRMLATPNGTQAELLGQMNLYWAVRLNGRTGTIPLAEGNLSTATQALVDARFPEAFKQQVNDMKHMDELFDAFYANASKQYGANSDQWPLETRTAYVELEERMGVYSSWRDMLPQSGDIPQELAENNAAKLMKQMWNIGLNETGWITYVAFGYERDVPETRCWRITVSRTDDASVWNQLLLDAQTGELCKTTGDLSVARNQELSGRTAENTMKEWTQRLGREPEEWTIQEQYEFSLLPEAAYDHYFTYATLPREEDVTEADARKAAEAAVMSKYGVSQEQLDAWRCTVSAEAMQGQPRCYVYNWFEWIDQESIWGCLYSIYVNMTTGEVYSTTGPNDGNG